MSAQIPDGSRSSLACRARKVPVRGSLLTRNSTRGEAEWTRYERRPSTAARRLEISDHMLLEFVEGTLQSGDVGMRASARAQREAEVRELERLAVQQAALRRVATLVAREASQTEVFAKVAEEIGLLLEVAAAAICRYEPGGYATVVGIWGETRDPSPVGTRLTLDGNSIAAQIYRNQRPARLDPGDYEHPSGSMATGALLEGVRSAVGSPVVVNGRLWGAVGAAARPEEALPADAEERIAQFTELVATAIANVQAREEVRHLADEQAALRRVATIVAQDVPPSELFTVVAREVGTLLGVDYTGMIRYEPDHMFVTWMATWAAVGDHPPTPTRSSLVPGDQAAMVIADTGSPARVDDWANVPGPTAEFARKLGVKSSVASPIVVNGDLWGALAVHSKRSPLPPDTELRLLNFSELVATAIANVQDREEVRHLADEQAALRRVATLVAQDVASSELFDAVAREVGMLLDVDFTGMIRYEPDHRFVTRLATWAVSGEHPARPTRSRIVRGDQAAIVAETGSPARIDDWTKVRGPTAKFARELGVKSSVACPIVVNGNLWGALVVHSKSSRIPPDTESRLLNFTELVATAIANAEARSEVQRLAHEQAALRRVATLVAQGASPFSVFDAVAEEMTQVLGADGVTLSRYEPSDEVTVLAHWGPASELVPPGTRASHTDGESVTAKVRRTKRPARFVHAMGTPGSVSAFAQKAGARAAVGAPIVVDRRLWGLAVAHWRGEEPPPADTEERMAKFAELLGTAMANAQARVELHGFANEQGALRRVATLVARAASPEAVLAAVAEEVGRLLEVDHTIISRYDPDGLVTLVSRWARADADRLLAIGVRLEVKGRNIHTLVYQTGRPARLDGYHDASGAFSDFARDWEYRSSVGVPIGVEGRLWGVMIVGSSRVEKPLPPDIEARLAGFTELVGTAIANADAQTALTASRARIVAASDIARRRIERDLHDGAQQQLVSLALKVRAAQGLVPPEASELAEQLDGAADWLTNVLEELREIARGIHPAVLAEGGLPPALKTLARRAVIPVRLDVRVEGRLPEQVELAAYFVVAEALTNAVKHAHATVIDVEVAADPAVLHVDVRDDGRGGADMTSGSGLVGLTDRVGALGGRLSLHSPPGLGTQLEIELPLQDYNRGERVIPFE
jgi:GAF domain-containing protein